MYPLDVSENPAHPSNLPENSIHHRPHLAAIFLKKPKSTSKIKEKY